MAKETNEIKKEEKRKVASKKVEKVAKTEKKTEPKKTKKTQDAAKKKKDKKVENKSVQNSVIENIKSFISKIIEMQEKVRNDEEDEKKQKKAEENEPKQEIELSNPPKYLLEYYDLPYRYNETVVKVLAQTPKRLFVYWDVADRDRITYISAFGENFFNDTYPVLLIHNEDKNYTSEVQINDFANSWYINISDPRDRYTIQLGRKFKAHIKPQINPEIEETNINLSNDYLFIAMSNKLEVPNDRILFDEFKPYVKYRNVKTKQEEVKNVEVPGFKNDLKVLYKELYNEEIILEERYDMLNPSSMGTSSSISK